MCYNPADMFVLDLPALLVRQQDYDEKFHKEIAWLLRYQRALRCTLKYVARLVEIRRVPGGVLAQRSRIFYRGSLPQMRGTSTSPLGVRVRSLCSRKMTGTISELFRLRSFLVSRGACPHR